MKKSAALSLALLIAAGAAFAEGGEGAWKAEGWVRANSGWDFEGDANLGKADGADPTGVGATLTYEKGPWTVAGGAEVTSERFGFDFPSIDATSGLQSPGYNASGNIKFTYKADGWEAWIKPVVNFAGGEGSLTNPSRTVVTTLELGVTKWNQADDLWGIKGEARLRSGSNTFIVNNPSFDYTNGDHKAGLFLNLWEKKILLESGFGDYADNNAWQLGGGPLEAQYEHADDKDSFLRVQVKPLTGLNLGFAYLPGKWRKDLGPVYANTADFKPGDTIRATTIGAKYDLSPLTVALGMNFREDNEALYAGLMYKALEERLALSLEGHAQKMGVFDTAGAFDLGEKVVFKDAATDGRFEAGLTLKQNALAGVDGNNLKLEFNPYAQYDIIEKTLRAKLGLEFAKGVGTAVEDDTKWLLSVQFGWSLSGSPHVDANDIGTGFTFGYRYGVEETTAKETTTNKVYFAFQAKL